MSCISLDLTIDGVLADPIIAAAMRADRVDPKRFERLLRCTARDLNERRQLKPLSFASLVDRGRNALKESKISW